MSVDGLADKQPKNRPLDPEDGDSHDRGAKTQEKESKAEEQGSVQPTPEVPFSIFTDTEKVFMVMTVSFMAMISPLTGSIYFPALPSLSQDLNVSSSLINLTVTTYLIFQGIAPSFIGNFSDSYGRRPAYMICCAVYLAANIGLAIQRRYAALLTLRCLQSCGSSATIALAQAVVADLVTRAQRGKFIGYAGMGITLGPALGPTLGGIIDQYLGWPAIFWFLAIFAGVLFLVLFVALPETCRAVVGNGALPTPWWNRSLVGHIKRRRQKKRQPNGEEGEGEGSAVSQRAPVRRRPNPFAALRILGEKEGGVTLGFGSLMYGGYYGLLTTLSAQLATRFDFNSVHIGLCYLPVALGSLSSRWTAGYLLDWNFRRHARRLGIEISRDRQQSLDSLPIERMRLEVSIPLVYASCVALMGYAWAMESAASLAGIEVSLFFCGLCFSGGLNGLNTLVVDTHAESPATAVAANNLFRCLVGAGATALAGPLIDRIGMGWTGTLIMGIWLAFSPCLWLVLFKGASWRKELKEKAEREKRKAKMERNRRDPENVGVVTESASSKEPQPR